MSSLRREIHSAFEVITPPLGGMPERVVQSVLAEKNGRLRKERMALRLRVSLALVAAVLIAAVGVAAVMEWNVLHNNVSPAGVGLTSVQLLEARPITLPTVQSAGQCPESATATSPRYPYGTGPVYADGGPETGTDWGHYWDVIWYAAPNLKGPVLIRGRDLITTDRRVVFVGPFAAGPVIGTEPNMGEQHTELVLDAGKPPTHDTSNRYSAWHIRQGMSNGWVGCVGFQIDGPGFSETITTFAAP